MRRFAYRAVLWCGGATVSFRIRSLFGACGRIRTGDLLITSELLCQLSHTSTRLPEGSHKLYCTMFCPARQPPIFRPVGGNTWRIHGGGTARNLARRNKSFRMMKIPETGGSVEKYADFVEIHIFGDFPAERTVGCELT